MILKSFFCLLIFYVFVSSDILGRVSLCCCVASVWLLVWVKLLALTWAWNQHFCLNNCVQALCPFSLAAESWNSSSLGRRSLQRQLHSHLLDASELWVLTMCEALYLAVGRYGYILDSFAFETVIAYWKWTCEWIVLVSSAQQLVCDW